MSDVDQRTGGRRRVFVVATSVGAGAFIGVALFAGVEGSRSPASSSAGAETQPTASANRDVASADAVYDARTIYDKDSPGVVDITVTEAASTQSGGGLSPFGPGDAGPQAQAEGTGFVYDEQGDIVTASHVVSGATKITVRFKDGTRAKATLVGADPSSDTAVIRVAAPAGTLAPLALADSSSVVPGEGVVAIGSPFGYAESITAGIVSAVDRDIEAPNNYAIPNTIQTDAAINHGNSGGPLIDSSGKVIGVNVQIATDDGGGGSNNAGVGFAVPSNTVKTVADDLIAGRAIRHPYLGISVGDHSAGAGARVDAVRASSPASKAGLVEGDVIVAVDGAKIASANQLTSVVAQHQPGDTLRLTVTRGGATLQVDATLGTRPATTSA